MNLDKVTNTLSLNTLASAAVQVVNPKQAALEELGRIVERSVPIEPVGTRNSYIPKLTRALPPAKPNPAGEDKK